MTNTARIDISGLSEVEQFKAEAESWSLDELKEWLRNNTEMRQFVEKQIKALTGKRKKMYTKTFDKADMKRNNTSDIIYERKLMDEMIDFFLHTNRVPMAGIAVLGFNTALRYGDIQKLRVCDVVDKRGNIKDYIILEEEKNKNIRTIYFNKVCRMILDYITEGKGLNEYLFTGTSNNIQKIRVTDVTSGSNSFVLVQRFLTEQAMCDAMKAFEKHKGIKEHYRTHTFRKSCINLIARECADIFRDRAYGNEVSAAFVGHKSVRTTEEYYLKLSEQERRTVHERLEVGLGVVESWCTLHKFLREQGAE